MQQFKGIKSPIHSFILLFLIFWSTLSFSQIPAEILIVGGGGGGGRNAGTYSSGGGGASGGQVTFSTTTISSGTVLTVIVGSGGNGYRNAPLINQTNGSASSISGTAGTWTAVGGNAGGNAEDDILSGSGGISVNADFSGAGGRGGIYENGNGPEGWPVIGGDGKSAYSAWGAATTTGELVSGVYYYGGGGAGGNWGGQSGGGVARSGYGGGGRSNSDAVANTGGGGGGANSNGSSGFGLPGGNGGSGIVIIRYSGTPIATGGIITESGGNTYHTFSGSGTFTVNAALPVNWLSFTAKNEQGTVRLSWKVSAEKNNLAYDIERSSDGLIFNRISSLNTSGDKSYSKQYSYTDKTLLKGVAFYRIKQVDIDGKFTYSSIASVNPEIKPDIQLGPNPIKDHIQISIPSNMTGIYELRISDMHGAVLVTKKLSPGTGSVNLPSVNSGMYVITLWKDGVCLYSKKLIK